MLVVTTRWPLIRVTLDGAPMRSCSAGIGFTERSVGRRLCVAYERVRWVGGYLLLLWVAVCAYLYIPHV